MTACQSALATARMLRLPELPLSPPAGPARADRKCVRFRDLVLGVAVAGYGVVMADATVGLADAIAALRKELLIAMDEGNDAPMRFRLTPVELSLQVAVTKEADGKIGWHVLGLGGSYVSATTQTLVLRLEPVWRKEDGSYTSDFTIADQGANHLISARPETHA